MKWTRSSNGWKLVVITGIAAIVTAVGIHHVWLAQRSLFLKRSIFVELLRNRTLVQEREVLERQVAELVAAPRVALRARDLLGMRPPKPDELIVVRPEAGGK